MVGGPSPLARGERLYRFQFFEQPGAIVKFLSSMHPDWNISLFHYRNQGADYGRILVGVQVPDAAEFRAFADALGTRGPTRRRTPFTACSCGSTSSFGSRTARDIRSRWYEVPTWVRHTAGSG
jgi:hypothetical protein